MEKDRIAITPEPLELAAAELADPAAGGICVFLGTTRSEASPSGSDLVALDYEAYEEMAHQQLHDLARRAREKWPVRRLVLVHRVGRVPVGEASVLIPLATPHRTDAFDCSRWLIDTLKAELAVWKKEAWADGTTTWTRPNREWKRPGER